MHLAKRVTLTHAAHLRPCVRQIPHRESHCIDETLWCSGLHSETVLVGKFPHGSLKGRNILALVKNLPQFSSAPPTATLCWVHATPSCPHHEIKLLNLQNRLDGICTTVVPWFELAVKMLVEI